MSAEVRGLWFGLLGMIGFSVTLPATHIALGAMSPWFIGTGRGLLAGLCAALLLLVTRRTVPPLHLFKSIAVVTAGVVLGFPLLSAWAMQSVPASHGAVVLGILPLVTAMFAVWRNNERPSVRFWVAAVLGSSVVVAFAIYDGAGGIQLGDFALLGAVIAAAMGYAEGARLTRSLPAWQVISWALVLSVPVLVVPALWLLPQQQFDVGAAPWLAFVYVALISQFAAFFAWYRGLSLGGVARVGQIQLLMPFFTIGFSAVLLNEVITWETLAFATLVAAIVAFGRGAPIKRAVATPPPAPPTPPVLPVIEDTA